MWYTFRPPLTTRNSFCLAKIAQIKGKLKCAHSYAFQSPALLEFLRLLLFTLLLLENMLLLQN